MQINKNKSGIMFKKSLILTSSSSSASHRRFFVYPDPMGSEEPRPLLRASSAQPKSIYSLLFDIY
jgi:hypothetical protein